MFAALSAAAAAAALGVVIWALGFDLDASALFWVLAALVLAGELLPIPVPRRHGLAKVTISTAFALAILIRFGAAPAIIVYAASVVIVDTIERVAPVKVLFNASQYMLAMASAAAVLSLAGELPLARITADDLPAVLAAGFTFFLVNHALACTAAALLADLPVLGYLRDDLAFQAWTAGCLLAFAPAVVASSDSSIWLVPVCFVPMFAIYVGGRQAAVNSHRAYHDALTELPNRVLLAESLATALVAAERERQSLAVMILDVDDFKAINDTLGHEFGDAVLKQIAQRLDHAVKEPGLLARLGGDEFAVMLPGGVAQAVDAAQRLLDALEDSIEIDSVSLLAAASIGIACFPQHGHTVRELLRHADVALYCAKASDAAYQVYAEEDDEYSIDRLALAAQLRRGIVRGELVVHYQPKAPLHGGPTNAVEALVRWNHPQLGLIGPDGFIPLAEQTGVIKPLTERVLESALRQCELWRRQGLPVSVSVNVSTRSLLDDDLVSMIRRLLERFGLPASVLQLEITESRIVADLRRARNALDGVRGLGVKIAIDDFGTGYSSLSQLQHLPIDEIKIDRSFVMRMDTHRNDAVLVRSIVELGRNLGLRVTAEGVESEEVRRTLEQLGCDYAQGFHIGRPATAEECQRHLGGSDRTRLKLLSTVGSGGEAGT